MASKNRTRKKKNRLQRQWMPCWVSLLAWPLCAAFITLTVIYLQPGLFRDSLRGIVQLPSLIFLNLLPAMILVGILFALLGNLFAGAAISALVLEALSYANLLKMEGRNDPLVPSDLLLLRESVQAVGDYQLSLHPWCLALLVGSVLFFVLLAVKFPSQKLRWPVRLTGVVILAGAFSVCMLTVYPDKVYYDALPGVSKSNVPQVYNTYGFPYCFLHNFNLYPVDKPAGYDPDVVKGWQGETLPAASPVETNILFVMGEAFTDLSEEAAFAYSQEENPTYLYRLLADSDQAISGHMVVSGFGAGTANTEFDVLTGMLTTMLSEKTSSSFRVVHRDIDSLARVYGEMGYQSFLVHPGQAWFYNRCSVYPHMGITDLSFVDSFSDPDYSGAYVSDAALGARLQEMVDARVGTAPVFGYVTTIENHQSYHYSKYADEQGLPVQTNRTLRAQAQEVLSVYFRGVSDTARMVYDLAQHLNSMDEPYMLVFFGDHRPMLGADYMAYREIGSKVGTEDDLQSMLYTYEVPYMIWCNDALYDAMDFSAAVEALELPPDHRISSNYLGSLVYEITGRIGSSAYWDNLTQARKSLPVIGQGVYELPDGTCTDQITQEQMQIVDRLHWWEYFLLKDHKSFLSKD